MPRCVAAHSVLLMLVVLSSQRTKLFMPIILAVPYASPSWLITVDRGFERKVLLKDSRRKAFRSRCHFASRLVTLRRPILAQVSMSNHDSIGSSSSTPGRASVPTSTSASSNEHSTGVTIERPAVPPLSCMRYSPRPCVNQALVDALKPLRDWRFAQFGCERVSSPPHTLSAHHDSRTRLLFGGYHSEQSRINLVLDRVGRDHRDSFRDTIGRRGEKH